MTVGECVAVLSDQSPSVFQDYERTPMSRQLDGIRLSGREAEQMSAVGAPLPRHLSANAVFMARD
jgi:hypothetical protein